MKTLLHVMRLSILVFTCCATVSFIGCGGKEDAVWSPFLSGTGTGVIGLDTPDQILKNPYVEEALEQASEEGVNITPELGVDPPVIAGTYDFTGEAVHPILGWVPLAPGTWRWYNQTADNHIDTEYDQIGLQTGEGGGEIIRGTGNRFTVYSVLLINDTEAGGCEERAVLIVDGEQDSYGNVSAVYVITPAQEPICHAITVGRLDLTLTGPAKPLANASEGVPIMRMIGDILSKDSPASK